MLKKIEVWFSLEDFILIDNFDDAIIGIEERSMRLIYSTSKCIDILINKMSLSEEDAVDYFYYNLHQSDFGEKTPIFSKDDL